MAGIIEQVTDQVLQRLYNGDYVLIIAAAQAKNIKNWGDLPAGGQVYGGEGVLVSATDGTARRVTSQAIAAYVQNAVNAHAPYVDAQTKTMWYWDDSTKAYKDSGVSVVGPPGPPGPDGKQGPQGLNGVAVAAAGQYAFNVDERGHLLCYYTGDTPPALSINEDGHLILEVPE